MFSGLVTFFNRWPNYPINIELYKQAFVFTGNVSHLQATQMKRLKSTCI